MSLYERYELLDLNRDDGVKTFEAREIATGRPVKVHLFVRPAAPLQAALLKAIDHLSESDRKRIVERGKHEGTPYVVTDRLPDYPGLSEWVQAASKSKTAKPALETAGAWKVQPVPPPPAPAPAPAAVPQESVLNQQFVELFTTAERPVVADSLLQSPQRPQSVAPVRPPEPARKQAPAEPGEFTRMFQAPAVAAPVAPPPAPPAAPPAKAEVGEFTKMFQAPKAPPPPPPAAPAPPAKEPGEFTRMFQASPTTAAAPPAVTKSGPGDFEQLFETRSPAGPMPHSPAVQQPLTPQAPGGSGPNRIGEFTQTFGKGSFDLAPPPPAAPAPKEPGEFTRMFHPPAAAAPPPAAPPAPAPFAPPPPAAPLAAPPSGPGDYTRQFSAPAQLTFGQTSATPAAPSAPSPQAYSPPAMAQPAIPNMTQAPLPPKKSNLILILGIAGIALVIVLLVVFFVMRPK